jgi:ribose/xylose/arabinose/galactoside ABC-type transport system permease subunit
MSTLRNIWARSHKRPEMLTLIALAVLLMFNLFFTKGFYNIKVVDGHLYGVLIDILKNGLPLVFIALGMTLVIGSGGVDISVGSVAAITAAMVVTLLGTDLGGVTTESKMPMALAIIIALSIAALCGIWNGLLISKFQVDPLIATLAFMVAGRGIAELITKGIVLTISYKPYTFIGAGWLMGIPFSIYLLVIFGVIIYLFTRKTAFGLYVKSVGTNKVATRYAGINSQSVIWSVYIICALMSGIAGIIISSNVGAVEASYIGLYIELDAILAVIIGGTSFAGGRFSFVGSVIGALLVQTLTTTIYMKGAPAPTILVYKAIVVICVGLLQTTDFSKIKKNLGFKNTKPNEVSL